MLKSGILSTLAVAAAMTGALLQAGVELPAKPGEQVAQDELIIHLRKGIDPQLAFGAAIGNAPTMPIAQISAYRVKVSAGQAEALAHQLAANRMVEVVEPNRLRKTQVVSPSDPNLSNQWALQTVQALQAWGLLPNRYLTSANPGANRIKVAVLDTGTDCTHDDFKNAGGTSTNSSQGGQLNFALSQAQRPTSTPGAACSWQDDHGHGTHTAGIIAAATNNATGVSSLGYPIDLITMKVMDGGGWGSDYDIANGITAAADAGARVISLSLGGAGYSHTMQAAVNYAWQRNALVVAATGNSGVNTIFFPAWANYAMGVGASDQANNRAGFSNYGDGLDIMAPGLSIYSTSPTYPVTMGVNAYANMSGTSMATPHVSALAGLVAMTTPNLSTTAIAQRITQSAASSATTWQADMGYGVINAYNAVAGVLRPMTAGRFSGQVVDSYGYPIYNATITVNGQSLTTGTDGLFRFNNLPGGNYPVTVTASGYPTQNLSTTIVNGADTNMAIAVTASYGRITGTVTAAGSGVSGIVVEAYTGGLRTATTYTDATGKYTLWIQAAGSYTVSTSGVGYLNATSGATNVTAGGNSTANLSVSKLGIVKGQVLSSGVGLAGVDIQLSGATMAAGAVTDGTGAFSTIGLPAGTYTVTATSGTLGTVTGTVTVSNDAIANVSLTFPGNTPPTPQTILVNTGGSGLVDALGASWTSDTGFTGGFNWGINGTVANTTTPALYKDQRYSYMPLNYNFAVANGTYNVTLKFAELSTETAGQRLFHVDLNGTRVLTNFDVYSAAGGPMKAVDQTFPVSVTNGALSLVFTAVRSSSIINAIQIVPSGTTPPPTVSVSLSPGTASLTAGQTQQFSAAVSGTTNTAVTWTLNPNVGTISNGLYTAPASITASQTVTVTATSQADTSKSASATVTLTPVVVKPPSGTTIRVNVGGPSFTDPNGNVWAADNGFNGGSIWSNAAAVAGNGMSPLYQVQRYSYSPLVYSTAVPNGSYNVTLKFAELSVETTGQRVFHVDINGARVLANFDVYTAAGGALRAVDKTFLANVTNGQIAITFTAVSSSAIVNAIEITPASTAVRINAGGSSYTDPNGNVWAADNGFSGGSIWSNSNPVANTTTPAVYQIQRYSYAPLTYTIPVSNGSYNVTLKFAELSVETTGQRVFHVDINGARVLTNFDVYSAAGGALKAVDKTFPVSVTNGQVTITLTSVSSSAIINAIEIQ